MFYTTFLLDYIAENAEYYEAKDNVYKDNFYLREHLQKKLVAPQLSKPRVRESLVEFTGGFMDNHVDQLSTAGPVHSFSFGDRETKFLYETFGITAEEIIDLYTAMVKETYYGSISKFFTGFVKNAPYKLLLISILMEAVEQGYDDVIECVEYLYSFGEYPIIFSKLWRIGVQEEVMNYTIEHLGSKYKIKHVKNLQGLIKYDAEAVVEFYRKQLATGIDNAYIDIIQRWRSQMLSKMRKIANAYYANVKANNTLHTTVSVFDDGSLADQEGNTTTVSRITEKVISKFGSGEINQELIKLAADICQVDRGNLSGFVAQIYATKNNRLSKFIEDIIGIYFTKFPSNTQIVSGEFINFGLSLYRSIGTSKDSRHIEIKAILASWMNDIINIRSLYERAATIINYTKAVYVYNMLMINYYT